MSGNVEATIAGAITIRQGPVGNIELVITLVPDDALDIALRTVGAVQAAQRWGKQT